MAFKVAVTVINKKDPSFPIWNATHLSMKGDRRDLRNLQAELEEVKNIVNTDVNKKGLSLRDVDVFIDILD